MDINGMDLSGQALDSDEAARGGNVNPPFHYDS